MSIENITFEKIDSNIDIAIKTALIFAGSTELKRQMQRLKIDYTKVVRGAKTSYILRGAKIGRVIVTL